MGQQDKPSPTGSEVVSEEPQDENQKFLEFIVKRAGLVDVTQVTEDHAGACGWLDGYSEFTKTTVERVLGEADRVLELWAAAGLTARVLLADKLTAFPPEFWANYERLDGKPLDESVWFELDKVYGGCASKEHREMLLRRRGQSKPCEDAAQ